MLFVDVFQVRVGGVRFLAEVFLDPDLFYFSFTWHFELSGYLLDLFNSGSVDIMVCSVLTHWNFLLRRCFHTHLDTTL